MTFKFETDPFKHQLDELESSKDLPAWAHLWEQGCVDCETEFDPLSPNCTVTLTARAI